MIRLKRYPDFYGDPRALEFPFRIEMKVSEIPVDTSISIVLSSVQMSKKLGCIRVSNRERVLLLMRMA